MQSAVDYANSVASQSVCKRVTKTVKKKGKKRKVRKTVCTPVVVGEDTITDITDLLDDAAANAQDEIDNRATARQDVYSIWFGEYTDSVMDPITEANSAAEDAINAEFDAATESLNGQLDAGTAAIENQRDQMVAAGGEAVKAARKASCSAKYKKKSQATKLKRCNKLADKRILPDDIETAADAWKDTAIDALADSISDQTDAIATTRDRKLSKQQDAGDREVAKAQRALDQSAEKSERTIALLGTQDDRYLERLSAQGQSALGRLAP